MSHDSELVSVDLPEFGMPTVEPEIDAETYERRIERLRTLARRDSYDTFVVYGDREHFANLAYLTGYDPRFEEALLVLPVGESAEQTPTLLVGNEGRGYAGDSPIADELDIELFQSFSLLGQDRSQSTDLSGLLRSAGVHDGARVGVAGWKHFPEFDDPNTALEIPAYLAETLRDIAGSRSAVRNANALLMDSSEGLRSTNEVDQLAQFEFAACHTSQAIRNVLFGVRPGMTEHEAVELMGLNGIPLSCHLMLSSGERAHMGLPSPSMRTIEHGDPFTTAYGAWGALNSRAGFMVEDADDLPSSIDDYVETLVVPYFEAVVAWYERVGIGVRGGDLYDVVHDRIGDDFFGVELNPGHLIHLDEWVDSPIYEGSDERLRSGMALQVDVIPATGTEYFMTNIEDGIALADEDLRSAFAERYPDAWERIQHRRSFVQDELGIELRPEVLPFSNIPAYLPPFLLSPERAMRVV